jgi:DinB superfamily
MPLPVVDVTLQLLDFFRERTLGTLAVIEKLPDPMKALGWRPGPGRAHIGWQITHVGITEELFATERLKGTSPAWADLVPRFKGGSTPDDKIPTLSTIRDILAHSREHLRKTLSELSESDLGVVPPALKERGINVARVLQILPWHEAHHQGQAHITLNLCKAQGVAG